jgi:hypothetical protein
VSTATPKGPCTKWALTPLPDFPIPISAFNENRTEGVVNWYSDIPEIFNPQGLIDTEPKEEWIRTIGFGNIAV